MDPMNAAKRLLEAFLSHHGSGAVCRNQPADAADVAGDALSGVDTDRLAASLAPLHVVLAALVCASTRSHMLHLQISMLRLLSPPSTRCVCATPAALRSACLVTGFVASDAYK